MRQLALGWILVVSVTGLIVAGCPTCNGIDPADASADGDATVLVQDVSANADGAVPAEDGALDAVTLADIEEWPETSADIEPIDAVESVGVDPDLTTDAAPEIVADAEADLDKASFDAGPTGDVAPIDVWVAPDLAGVPLPAICADKAAILPMPGQPCDTPGQVRCTAAGGQLGKLNSPFTGDYAICQMPYRVTCGPDTEGTFRWFLAPCDEPAPGCLKPGAFQHCQETVKGAHCCPSTCPVDGPLGGARILCETTANACFSQSNIVSGCGLLESEVEYTILPPMSTCGASCAACNYVIAVEKCKLPKQCASYGCTPDTYPCPQWPGKCMTDPTTGEARCAKTCDEWKAAGGGKDP